MSAESIIAIIASIMSICVAVTALIVFFTNRKEKAKADGADEARTAASLDTIKLQNESLLQGNHTIQSKLDDQNVRITKIEQTVNDAHLSDIPKQIASLEMSVKSAHKRLDNIEQRKK